MPDLSKGKEIYDLCGKIFPICRSLTGVGVRETLTVLDEYISNGTDYHLNIHEVPTGTKVFDWTVPKEWAIRDGYIEDESEHRIVDFNYNNLHVMGYSTPVDKWIEYGELMEHIYTQPDQPDLIPYVTSYYSERYGFCMSENTRKEIMPGKYHVYIDSDLFEGSLTYGDLVIKGQSEKEILLTTYICHPSMANDICSGMVLLAGLIKYVAGMKNRRYTYRFVFEPETIGAIAYISNNIDALQKNVIAAINLSCVGDNNAYSIIETIEGNTLSDRILNLVLKDKQPKKYSFLKRGSDERQYASPGVDVPMVCFCRSKFGEFPEYHTSADNMDFVSPEGFQGSYDVMTEVINGLEGNETYISEIKCEAQLGKRGLYPTTSQKGSYDTVQVYCDLQAYANGKRDLIEIADKIEVPMHRVLEAAETLRDNNIISIVK